MPTPPPWCTDTQVAPADALSSAFSTGQSAMASLPSRMPSVSRFGDATEPVSRWSRPMTIGAEIAPARTSSLIRQSKPRAVAVAEPADPRRQSLERHALARHADPATQCRIIRKHLERRVIGHANVVGIS